MRDKRVKKIFEFSKRKKGKLERGFTYWEAVFLGFFISAIMIGFEILNKFLNTEDFDKFQIMEFIVLAVLTIKSIREFRNRLLALDLKEEDCRSIKKARELLNLSD